ncbi:MAG: peptide MFS transporter, partial [Deltaproteobacteria bacterium]|nr:peptide MFS transporter [Deltaproteobacteria bacterium]
PVGLFVLFFTEMWERMSYYGMRALLVLYMTRYLFVTDRVVGSGESAVHLVGDPARTLGFEAIRGLLGDALGVGSVQQLASQVYGLYTALVYLTPVLGGLLADRLLGQRRAVVLGALIMALGHFLMAVESLFFVALGFLIAGNGAFKPNISTQVGALYPEGDARRDGAFTLFYMGINLGAFLSPLVCGTLGQRFGWHYGFGAAGVGMLLGLGVYLWGQRYLPDDPVAERGQGAREPEAALTPDEWRRVGAIVLLCLLNVVFWAVYEQQGNTMQLWADERTDWRIVPGTDLELPSTWYQSMNPAMIFLFAPLLDRVWRRQAAAGREPATVTKMAIGCLLLGAAFLVMLAAAMTVPASARGSVWWLVGTTLVLTAGELYLSPVGLSLVSKVAPRRMISLLMGVWLLSSFFGNFLSGYLGTFWDTMPKERFFLMLAALAASAGLVMGSLRRPIARALGSH